MNDAEYEQHIQRQQKPKEVLDRPRSEIYAEYNKGEYGVETVQREQALHPAQESQRVRAALAERTNEAVKAEAAGFTGGAMETLVANDLFRETYPEICSDPVLGAVAQATNIAYKAAGDKRHPTHRAMEIGERLTEIARNPENKQALAAVAPEAAARMILESSKRTAPEIIMEMRKARGQVV